MRTRLMRPEFWTDSVMADLPYGTRLTYIGLWCLADDGGYLLWDSRQIAAELYRYEAPKVRERHVREHLARLVDTDRVRVLDCGRHALIPSLPDHRIKGGEQLYTVQKQHDRRCTTETSVGLRRTTSDSVSVSVSGSLSETDTGSDAPRSIDPWKELGKKYGSKRTAA